MRRRRQAPFGPGDAGFERLCNSGDAVAVCHPGAEIRVDRSVMPGRHRPDPGDRRRAADDRAIDTALEQLDRLQAAADELTAMLAD